MNADPSSGSIPLSVMLRANVSGAVGNVEYLWALSGAERDVRAGETYTTLVGEAGSYTYSVTVSDG